jgi:UPF0755 protein
MDFNIPSNTERKSLFFWKRFSLWQKLTLLLAFIVIAGLAVGSYFSSPKDFPVESIVHIEKGLTLTEIAEHLKATRIIQHPFLFRSMVISLGGERSIVGGNYFFEKRLNVMAVARRVIRGDYNLEPIKVTIPEGTPAFEIGKILKDRLGIFKFDEFVRLAQPEEGYLFPDTYFLLPNNDPAEVIMTMKENFTVRLSGIENAIKAFGKPLKDVIVMASIVEEEAMDSESRRIVSGILWKRLKLGMPLQVDASFQYVNGKASLELTTEDLKIDSPYNTYKYTGLPPGPISNPGLDSIIASVTPTKTAYLYFLSDRKGKMYYASTFEEHVRNKERYLR